MIRTAFTVAATTFLIVRPTLAKAMATTANAKVPPTLKGVVFDMDDTLVRSNLDIKAMYTAVFGAIPERPNFDILKEMSEIKNPEDRAKAYQIVETIEEESRQEMKLMPGCTEVLTWLSSHNIPKALVTRNSRATTDAFCQRLQDLQQESDDSSRPLSFDRTITRDDTNVSSTTTSNKSIPPKPDPTAMNILAKECFQSETCEILMVGDSVSNDIVFGKNAGTQTALLLGSSESSSSSGDKSGADVCVNHLTELPSYIWKSFSIAGPLGNTPEANQKPLHGSPPPQPQSDLCRAVVSGDVEAVRALLKDNDDENELLLQPDEINGNTALIWACDTGNAEITGLLLAALAAQSRDDDDDDKTTREEKLSSYVNHRGFLGATALNRAARRGHAHILKLLLGDDDSSSGIIPGKLVDRNLPNAKLQHPLHFAAFKKNPEALAVLLQNGANPWVLDRKGRTPLQDTSCETCKGLLRDAMNGDNNH